MNGSNDEAAVPTAATRTAPPIGRTLRLLVGAWLLFVVVTNAAGRALPRLELGMGAAFVALLLLYVVLHLLLAQRQLNAWVGKLVVGVPVALLYFLGSDPVKLGVLAFFGVSLLVAAIRGDPGCEVTTIPTLLFRRPAYLPCFLFSPLDHLEQRIRRSLRR